MTTVPHLFRATEPSSQQGSVAQARAAGQVWARTPVRTRVKVLRRFRAELAAGARELAFTVPNSFSGSLHRSEADTLVAEVLPLAEACRFLEREAEWILCPRRESTRSRPFWLRSVEVEIERAPLGVVLVIAPGNYPLFLPGAQALQALAAGNAVLWKPAPSGVSCAHAVRVMLIASGLPPELLTILDPAPAAAARAIEAGVDKVFLTGSAATGEAVLHALAASATPSVMELSGCDAVFVLPGADLTRVVEALSFGLRFNGSATCMAPRRVFVAEELRDRFAPMLAATLAGLGPVPVPPSTREHLRDLLAEAAFLGARTLLNGLDDTVAPNGEAVYATLLANVTPDMRIAQADLFAPVLSLLSFRTLPEAAAMHDRCPYALTAAIFGPPSPSRELAGHISAGTVLLNDLIVSTADPRVPFSGRKRSGFGATRGREGLLEMTAPRAIVRQRGRRTVAFQATMPAHAALFAGFVQAVHGGGLRARLEGLRTVVRALPGLKPSKYQQ